ncbi:MAG: heat shock protein HtpX, partial [Acidobacteriaceae bacterium]|nr:heat shock protein HtpX [Acidobacteriaceae bacterium]
MGGLLGKSYLLSFAVLALIFNVAAYWFSDRLVLALHRVREIAPQENFALHNMVLDLARRANIPAPRLYLIPDEQPNAFATGRSPEKGVIAVTRGLLKHMPPRELRSILAHEIAHIRNRDTLVASVAAAIAGAISYSAQALSFTWLFGNHSGDDESSLGDLAIVFVAPFMGFLLQMGISRSREYIADETAARLTNEPEVLAEALRRLERCTRAIAPARSNPATASLFVVNPFLAKGGVSALFSTHPPIRLRIRRLRVMAQNWHLQDVA